MICWRLQTRIIVFMYVGRLRSRTERIRPVPEVRRVTSHDTGGVEPPPGRGCRVLGLDAN